MMDWPRMAAAKQLPFIPADCLALSLSLLANVKQDVLFWTLIFHSKRRVSYEFDKLERCYTGSLAKC